MKFMIITLACLVAVVVGELTLASLTSHHHHQQQQEWILFKRQHGKSYSSQAEDARRFVNYLATKQRVERHNAKLGDDDDSSFTMELNHLADWNQEELARMNGLKVSADTVLKAQANLAKNEAYLAKILGNSQDEPVPEALDWRLVKGRVSSVKDQGQCGSCWAFSTIGALEGQEKVRLVNKTGPTIPLSEQELVDCSISNNGCNGGIMSDAFDDLALLGGAVSGKDYPYRAEDGKCVLEDKQQKRRIKSIINDAGHIMLPAKDEIKLKRALARFGPISVALDATNHLQSYKSGVLNDKFCSSEASGLNHGVLLVGYGTDSKSGDDYWIVKNSWGANWGEQGYFKIKRGLNMCGIALLPTIPKF